MVTCVRKYGCCWQSAVARDGEVEQKTGQGLEPELGTASGHDQDASNHIEYAGPWGCTTREWPGPGRGTRSRCATAATKT